MFLTRDELVEMTGARRSSSICQWLKDQKLPFRLGRDNWPRVLRSVVLIHFGDVRKAEVYNEPQLHL